MKTYRPLGPAAIILAVAACASVDVRTATSPDANLSKLRTFSIYWDYGYPYYPRWWGFGPYEQPTVTQYTQGTVIVDVIDPNTKELLWRGQGVANVSDNEAQYEQDLWKTVTAILDKFPRAPQAS